VRVSTAERRKFRGIESAGLISVESLASSGGHSGNQCVALSFF